MWTTRSRWGVGWIAVAFATGAVAGLLDLHADEVQGPLLVLMAGAFVAALVRRTPPWMIGAAATLGLPMAHLVARLGGLGEGPSWGMVIALVPAIGAAYAGAFVGALIARTSDTVPRPVEESRSGHPWYRRPATSRILLFSSLLGCAVVGAVPVYATLLARGQPVAWWVTTWWQITTLAGWAMLAPLILALRRRFAVLSGADDGTPITMVELAAHAGIITIAALGHSAILVMFTRLLFVPLGVATTLSAIGWAFAAYFLLDALAYVLIFALAHASDIERRAREASRRTALLVAQLDQSRLVALRAQLRPHFLFNALNAAVVLVRRGDAEAATVLTGLAELLRYVLDDGEEMVSLDEELTFAGRYLAIEQVRVGERLRFAIDAAADVRIALVPRLMLQPIVENAVRHGIAKQLRPGEIRVRATRAQETLILCVEDDGPGLGALAAAGAERDVRAGIGLSNTRARLESLFGASASVTLRAREGGGAVTEILLPYLTEHRARSA